MLMWEKYDGNSKIKAYIAPHRNFLLDSQLLIYNKEFSSIYICPTLYINKLI